MKAAFRYIAVPEEAYRIAGPHRIIPMDLWAQAHGSRLRTVRITERQWEPEVSRRHARTVLSDLVTAGLLMVGERGDRGSVYRVVDASTGSFGEGVYHNADRNADHNCPEPTSEPDTNADRNAYHARVDPRAGPTVPYLTLPSTEDELRVETSSTEEAIVPQGAALSAAPPALGPADPATDEPDWETLLAPLPLTYGDDDEQAAEDEGFVGSPAGSAGVASHHPAIDGGAVAPEADAVPRAVDEDLRGDGPARPGSLLTLDATRPPPAIRRRKSPRPAPVGDVETLWEAWRAHGTVRGSPNPKRRGQLTRALEAHGLPAMLDLLEAAHTGAGDYWRHLQGATSRNDSPYLSPETLLNGRLDERIERAAAWVEQGRPTHDVAETRVEVRAEVAAKSLAQRAKDAWDKVVIPNRGASGPRFSALLASWGDSPRAEEARRAVLGGLTETRGLSAVGQANDFTRPALRAAFMRGFAAALGGTVTEAELREVG